MHRYVRGEACVTMGFSLHASKLNGGEPLNAILGSAINQDGRSSSLTAPNGPSQQQASILIKAFRVNLNRNPKHYTESFPLSTIGQCTHWKGLHMRERIFG